ncbi:MAG TPA: PspA/IM30 family protein [Lacipirellulaceae bacterium]|jgi:phage shock protein A|nr:PspA/IM30 family protein [Lacipirellulaceae bacterium]
MMGIFRRISDIVSANLNDLTDGWENPEQMLRQAIREMEESIGTATRETARALANTKLLDKELQKNRDQAGRWQQRAEQSIAAGDDELARKALSRKREHEKLIIALEDQLNAARNAAGSLKRQLEGMKVKLAEAKRSLATLSARQRAADFRKKMDAASCDFTTDLDDDAFAKFERLRNRVEQSEAEAEAMAELRGTTSESPELDNDFELDDEADVDGQLAELKKKMAK